MANMEHEFEKIYREYATLIYRYLISIGCPAQDAEDITQDTFVKALLNIDSYRGDSKLSVWLCQIAKNTWLTHLKRQKRQVLSPPPDSMEHSAYDNYSFEWINLIEQLEEPYRTVFMKKALGDWSYTELARQYGKSESWARVTFYRARLQIQQMMNERRI